MSNMHTYDVMYLKASHTLEKMIKSVDSINRDSMDTPKMHFLSNSGIFHARYISSILQSSILY